MANVTAVINVIEHDCSLQRYILVRCYKKQEIVQHKTDAHLDFAPSRTKSFCPLQVTHGYKIFCFALITLTTSMTYDAQNVQLVLDAIPCGAKEKPDLKLAYNSVSDGNTPQAFLNKCALLSPTVTVLTYGSGLPGYLGFYMSNPWCTRRDADQWSGRSWNSFSKKITDDDAFLFYDFPSNNLKHICHAQNGGVHFGVQTSGGYGIYVGRNAEICFFFGNLQGIITYPVFPSKELEIWILSKTVYQVKLKCTPWS